MFFAQLETVLSAEQRERMPRIRDRRGRNRANPDHLEMNEARIDLVDLLSEHRSCAGLESGELNLLIAEYESELSVHVINLDAHHRSRGADLLWYLLWRRYADDETTLEMSSSIQKQRSAHFGSLRNAILAESLELQQRIISINRRYLEQIALLVSAPCIDELKKSYQVLVYPHVFPDPHDPARIHAAFQASDLIADDVRDGAKQVWDKHQSDVAVTNAAMCEMIDKSMEDMARYQGIVNHVAVRASLRQLRDKRWALHESVLSHLKNLLPPDDDDGLSLVLTDAIFRIRAQRIEAERDSFPGW
jgi:hypothetical protein